MKKMTKFWALALSGLMFAACSNDGEIVPNPDTEGDGQARVQILLNTGTRADGGSEEGVGVENTINNLDFYVFKSTGELAEMKAYDAPASGGYMFKISEPGSNMKFLVAINQSLGDVSGMTYDEVRALISDARAFTSFAKSPVVEGNALAQPNSFPMSGWTTASVTAVDPNNPSAVVTSVSINVNRLISKIDAPKLSATFQNKINLSAYSQEMLKKVFGDDIPATGVDFSFDGYVFANGIDKTDAFFTWNTTGAEGSVWDTWNRSTGKSYLNSTFDTNGYYTGVYAGTTNGDMFLNSSNSVIYAYENMPADDEDEPDTEYDRKTVYSFIIKGTLTDVDIPANKFVRYWRANLIPDDKQKVLRNSIYRMTIDAVSTLGYGTPKEAEEQKVPKGDDAFVQVSINVVDWKIKLTNTEL